jgi:hypothetical protein
MTAKILCPCPFVLSFMSLILDITIPPNINFFWSFNLLTHRDPDQDTLKFLLAINLVSTFFKGDKSLISSLTEIFCITKSLP